MAIDNLKPGDIVLYSGRGFLPKAIQLFQGRKWNHVGLVVAVDGDNLILEAVAEGVVLNDPIDSFKKSQIMIMRPRFDIGDPKVFSEKAINMSISKPYDFAALLWHQLVFTLTGRSKWVGRKHTAEERLYCSEVAAYVYHEMFDLFPNWFKTNPAMIREDEVNFEPIKNFD